MVVASPFSVLCRFTPFLRHGGYVSPCNKCNNTLIPKMRIERSCATVPLEEILKRPQNLPPSSNTSSATSPGTTATENEQKNAKKYYVDQQHTTGKVSFALSDLSDFVFRTMNNDPALHSSQDLSKYFTVDSNIEKGLQMEKIVREEFSSRCKALNDYAMMVREPTLECLDLIKACAKKDSIAAKVMLYGKDGCGKSLTFAHNLAACYSMNWFVVFPPNTHLWNIYFKQIEVSTRKV